MNAIVLMILPVFFGSSDDLWPTTYVPKPEGAKRYEKTQWSVSLFTVEGDSRDWEEPVHNLYRTAVDGPPNPNSDVRRDWVASGGLKSIKGWRSDGYLLIPKGKHILYWQEKVTVGGGFDTVELRKLPFAVRPLWKSRHAYPDGTQAFDNLTYKGETFELRRLEKQDGVWRAKVLYKDMVKAPPGYLGHGKSSCFECHNKAGDTSAYGTAIRGDDGLFSPPVWVEGTRRPNPELPMKPYRN